LEYRDNIHHNGKIRIPPKTNCGASLSETYARSPRNLYIVVHTVSNTWISDYSYNTGTEITVWSRHAHH